MSYLLSDQVTVLLSDEVTKWLTKQLELHGDVTK